MHSDLKVRGFQFAGLTVDGAKKKNLGLLYSTQAQTIGAAVYTRNDVKAAPVLIDMEQDRNLPNKRFILVNSGNANAFTGKKGMDDARESLNRVALALKISRNEGYVASTGVIGQPMPMDKINPRLDSLVRSLSETGFNDFTEAIMTTDTKPKTAAITYTHETQDIALLGCVKGAGMIMPNMATMLCFVVTDAAITSEMLKKALQESVEDTFNSITVDSDTSTNDTVFILANRAAENPLIDQPGPAFDLFRQSLRQLLENLALQLIDDAEGKTKRLTIDVAGARDYNQAKTIAFSIANSPLVKTAFFGQQLNWGRIAMAVGKAMTNIDPNKLDILVNDYKLVMQGEPVFTPEIYRQAEESLKKNEINISVNLNLGPAKKRVWTCDLSIEYIKINANYIS